MSTQTVLVIESDTWLGDHYQRQLEAGGYLVTRASNAFSAIDMIDETPPAAIVMSMLLSGPGALNLLHELQSYADTAAIPVIVCGNAPGLSLDELQPYGVRYLIDSTSMRPGDIAAAVRSVTI